MDSLRGNAYAIIAHIDALVPLRDSEKIVERRDGPYMVRSPKVAQITFLPLSSTCYPNYIPANPNIRIVAGSRSGGYVHEPGSLRRVMKGLQSSEYPNAARSAGRAAEPLQKRPFGSCRHKTRPRPHTHWVRETAFREDVPCGGHILDRCPHVTRRSTDSWIRVVADGLNCEGHQRPQWEWSARSPCTAGRSEAYVNAQSPVSRQKVDLAKNATMAQLCAEYTIRPEMELVEDAQRRISAAPPGICATGNGIPPKRDVVSE